MTYSEKDIEVLEGLEAVRKRPGMYVGGTDKTGFHHLLWEVVDNSIDEVMAGHADTITVTLSDDKKTATVEDNGRGIPTGKHKSGGSTLDVVFTKLHAGGKFGGSGYKVSGGLHGVGSAVVNALSSCTEVRVLRGGRLYSRTYERGKPKGRMTSSAMPKAQKKNTGTIVSFTPDPDIFGKKAQFDPELVLERLAIKAYLNSQATIVVDLGDGEPVELHFDGGLGDYLEDILGDDLEPIHPPFVVTATDGDARVEVALAWTENSKADIRSFANGIPTRDGGTHVQGLRDVLGRVVRQAYDLEKPKVPKKWKLTRDDILEGLVAIVSVHVVDPQFQGQTKDRLNNADTAKMVSSSLSWDVEKYLQKGGAEPIVSRVVQSLRARYASRDAAAIARRKSPLSSLRLPGKLSDCSSSEVEQCELYLVEGDSAGGSAKQGRNRKLQAILPLRGKVLNTESASLARLIKNEEIKNIVDAMGCGIGPNYNPAGLRYGKLIIMVDADDDGAHIATLLLIFFYRHMPELIEAGRIFLAQPPLYALKTATGSRYALDEAELAKAKRKLGRKKYEVMRFKGLGEMDPKELYATTMDPARRRLLKIEVPSDRLIETEALMADLMGKDASRRMDYILDMSN